MPESAADGGGWQCPSLLLMVEGGSDATCVRYEQGNYLLSMMAELTEEVERLRNINEYEQEKDQWSNSLPYL